MFKFNNTHIFTGYLKQKLSSVNIPTCKIYTQEFIDYMQRHGEEDPRIVESFNTYVFDQHNRQLATHVNYLKDNEVYNYFVDRGIPGDKQKGWVKSNSLYYNSEKRTPGLTKTLYSPGRSYDTTTHEYLGDYLRFLRDYHGVNLMSLYNCFNNNVCSNLDLKFTYENKIVEFASQDSKYIIYAFPVKLFSNYTIAIDSHQGIEICCGLYHTNLYSSDNTSTTDKDQLLGTAQTKAQLLGAKTYKKVSKTIFNQPILFDKLNIKNWDATKETKNVDKNGVIEKQPDQAVVSRHDIINKEQDLKMFIKVPVSCRSSIVVLEGDYRSYNNATLVPNPEKNLTMSGCNVGSKCTIHGSTSDTVKDYTLSTWRFGYPLKDSVGLIVPSIEFVDTPEDISIWEQDSVNKPEFLEEGGYCKICTGAELAYVVKNNGKTVVEDSSGNTKTIQHYRLENDIYLNDPTKINWDTGELKEVGSTYQIRSWFSTTETKSGFSGVIEGNGHTIYGLYFKSNNPDTDYSGLIPLIDVDKNTVLKDLGLNCIYLRSSFANAFVGGSTDSINSADKWLYSQNHSIVCMGDNYNDNDVVSFKPISKLQLLEFNTGESYPFADRLVEYLSGSAITPLDEISDNIKRTQRVMKQNNHYFKIEGLWENKMQKILYDYIMNSGPIEILNDKLIDKRNGYHASLGHTNKSTLYDILGYVDRDTEKWYASFKNQNGKVITQNNIQNIDIYDSLYDL